MNSISEMAWINEAVTSLAECGFYFGSSIVDPLKLRNIVNRVRDADQMGRFQPAGVGRENARTVDAGIRGDRIFWLSEPGETEQDAFLLGLTEHVRRAINRELFAGLQSFEGHYAIYPAGGFYHRHVDSFKSDDSRMITFILYLNEEWLPEHGGCLRVFKKDNSSDDYVPRAGNVVLFKSRDFPHEVLRSTRERLSFTGWFKVTQGLREQ